MQKYDAVIIGSGLGGLSAGATLAKKGKKVLVLEQHNLIGGCATCFKRKGMLVDAGLHEMDWGDASTDMKRFVFENLGLLDKIELIPLPSAWSVIQSKDAPSQKQILIPHQTTKEALIALFPHEREGIEKYFKKIRFQAKLVRRFSFDMGFWEFFVAPLTTLVFFAYNIVVNKTTGDVLDSCIQDSKLKRILNINIAYYHHDPYRFIWSYHAIPQHNYYSQGVYIKGGSQSLSDALSAIITENGGEVRANADVTEILMEGKKAIGVSYMDKKDKKEVQVFGTYIIANCDPHIVYHDLLKKMPIEDFHADLKVTQDFKITSSLVSIYMIFDKNLSEIYPDMDYSTFLVESEYFDQPFDRDHTDAYKTPIEKRDFAFINYSKIESGLSDREDRFLAVGTVCSYFEEWELDKEEYKAKKESLRIALEERLEKQFPGIMQHCIHSELSTPKTIQRYTRTRKGAIYGYDQDKENYLGRERFKSKSVENLYFSSAFGFPGGGFTGAILGGYRVARKILDPYLYVRRISACVLVGFAITQGIQYLFKAF